MASEMVTLPAAAIPDLRRMLLIGLAALGEVERVRDNIDTVLGSLPDERRARVRPVHPTGAHEMSKFATALLWLDHAREREE